MPYKLKTVEWMEEDACISIDCLYEEDDPGFDDEWIPDMATLQVNGDAKVASEAEHRYLWGKAWDLANEDGDERESEV